MSPVVSGLSAEKELPFNTVGSLPVGVQLADFYAELYFPAPSMPAEPPSANYLIGFCFWADAAGNC